MNREEIVAALAAAESAAAALRRMLAEVGDTLPEHAPKPRWVDTSVACKILGRSPSWCYANAGRFGLGHRTESGSWAYDENKCRAFRAGMVAASEDRDAAAVSVTTNRLSDGDRTA